MGAVVGANTEIHSGAYILSFVHGACTELSTNRALILKMTRCYLLVWKLTNNQTKQKTCRVARPMCMRTSRESRDIMKINTTIREQSTHKTLGGFFNYFFFKEEAWWTSPDFRLIWYFYWINIRGQENVLLFVEDRLAFKFSWLPEPP